MAKFLFTALVTLLTAGIYCFYAFWSYHPSDDGVVLAMAWRVANGEVPFRDFISMRPPLSAYLHSLWLLLPWGSEFLAARLGFFVQVSLTVLLPVWWALGRSLVKVSMASLCLVAFFWFLAIHIFPPMPWPTVDGVMFGYIGLFCWLLAVPRPAGQAYKLAMHFTAGLCFFLAALCKQNFIVLPVWYLCCSALLLIWQWRKQGRFSGQMAYEGVAVLLSVLLPAGVFIWLLHAAGALTQFHEQVILAHVHRYLGMYGFTTYYPGLKKLLLAVLLIIGAGLAGWFFPRVRRILPITIMAAGLLGLTGLVVYSVLIYPDPYERIAMGAKWALWLVLAAAALLVLRVHREGGKDLVLLLVLISGVALLGWSASLSIGWNNPLLGLGGGGVILAMALQGMTSTKGERGLVDVLSLGCALIVGASFLIFNYQHPYMDQPRSELTHDLGRIYPRFGLLYTNEQNYTRHAALASLSRELAQSHPQSRLAVVGEFPLFHYLSGTRNPTSIDWWNPWEYLGMEDRLQRELLRPGLLIILDCVPGRQGCRCYPQKPGEDKMKDWIRRRFPLLTKNGFFCVFGVPINDNVKPK